MAGHFARAAVESIAFQTRDVLDAMQRDSGVRLKELKVDGGASVNDSLLQFQADILQTTVQRPRVAETTALGAAYLAGLAVGYWESQDEISSNWVLDQQFIPQMSRGDADGQYAHWQKAVQRSLDWAEH